LTLGGYRIRLTRDAEDDLVRLYAFLLQEDEMAAESAIGAIRSGLALLSFSPFACRKARSDLPRHRELVIPFGRSGYVALFEIDDAQQVTVIAIRHQREHDLL
jgi:plasmid stabilization system protein ParE